MTQRETLNELNRTHCALARVGLDMQCQMRYALDDIRRMIDDGDDPGEIVQCIDMYDEEIGDKVLRWGELNEKAAGLASQLIKGLIRPPIETILRWLRRRYRGRAGWK